MKYLYHVNENLFHENIKLIYYNNMQSLEENYYDCNNLLEF